MKRTAKAQRKTRNVSLLTNSNTHQTINSIEVDDSPSPSPSSPRKTKSTLPFREKSYKTPKKNNLNPPKSHVITLDNHLLDNSIITKANKLKTTSKKSNKRKIEEENETEVIQINTENSPNLKKDKSPTNILSRSSAKSPSNSPAKSPSKFPKSSPKSSSSKEEQAASGITIVITKKKEKRPSKKAKTLKDALDYTISKVTQWNKKAYSNDKILLESLNDLCNSFLNEVVTNHSHLEILPFHSKSTKNETEQKGLLTQCNQLEALLKKFKNEEKRWDELLFSYQTEVKQNKEKETTIPKHVVEKNFTSVAEPYITNSLQKITLMVDSMKPIVKEMEQFHSVCEEVNTFLSDKMQKQASKHYLPSVEPRDLIQNLIANNYNSTETN